MLSSAHVYSSPKSSFSHHPTSTSESISCSFSKKKTHSSKYTSFDVSKVQWMKKINKEKNNVLKYLYRNDVILDGTSCNHLNKKDINGF